MAKFASYNTKNTSTSHISFELNYGYHPYISYKKDLNLCFKSKAADELAGKLRELMTSCQKNLRYTQEFQKQVYDKDIKPKSYTPGNKIWLNSKYIKTKQDCKLESMFFGPF